MKNNYLSYAISLTMMIRASFGYAETIVVSNTIDEGVGSLRQAMLDAESNSGADTIVFNIPTSDPNYNSETGAWTIQLATDLPFMENDSTVIDGTSQTANQGDKNIKGPEIEINGADIIGKGFKIHGSDNVIKGMVINRFSLYGIAINEHRNKVIGNYIGTDATGTFAMPNGNGTHIGLGAKYNIIGGSNSEERNLISGNSRYGIMIQGDGTDSNMIKGNYIGTNSEGEDTMGNIHGGILLLDGPTANIVGGTTEGDRNIISGTPGNGSGSSIIGNGIAMEETDSNRIIGNYIGTNKSATTPLPNEKYGIMIYNSHNNVIGDIVAGAGNIISGYKSGGIRVSHSESKYNIISGNYIGNNPDGTIYCEFCQKGVYLDYGAHDNMIGPENVITNNLYFGVNSYLDTTFRNTITHNIITGNGDVGIRNEKGANNSLAEPEILDVTSAGVIGTACADCIVEIFSDSVNEGAIYEGSIIANEAGNFTWEGNITGPFVTATATDALGNTSEFSDAYAAPTINAVPKLVSEEFSLEQNIPNPFSISTEIRYSLSNSAHIKLIIYDMAGKEVIRLVDEFLTAGDHSVTWNGKDSNRNRMPTGVYFYAIDADVYKTRKMLVLFNQ